MTVGAGCSSSLGAPAARRYHIFFSHRSFVFRALQNDSNRCFLSQNFDTQWDGSIAGGRHPTESFGPNTFNHPNTWGMYAGAGKMKLADDMQAHGAAVYAPCDKQLGKNGPH